MRVQKYKISGNHTRKDVKILNLCAILGQNDTVLGIFRYFCNRNAILTEREPKVFQDNRKLPQLFES
jgi:hypothetical protein